MARGLELWTPRSGAGKPGINSQVDWMNPLARGLVALWLFNEGAGRTIRNYAAMHRDSLTIDNTGVFYKPGVEGLAFKPEETTTASLTSPSAALKPTAATLYWRGVILGDSGSHGDGPALAGMYYNNNNADPFTSYCIDRSGANQTDVLMEYSLSDTYTAITLSSAISNGTPRDYALSVNASEGRAYMNGVSQATGNGGTLTYGGTAMFGVNRHSFTTTEHVNELVQIVAIWNRALSAAEHRAMSLDPYALLISEETVKSVWLMAVSAGGTTPKTVNDTGSGSDAISLATINVTVDDTGSGSDAIAMADISLTVSDTGTSSETVDLTISMTISDTGTDSESISLATIAVPVNDTGTDSESISLATITLTVNDTGTGTDTVTVDTSGAGTPKTVSDTGTDSETITLATISLTVDQAGTGTETISLATITLTLADTGSIVDAVAVTRFFNLNDTGGGSDAILMAPITPVVNQSATGTNALSLAPIALAVPDTGAGINAVSVLGATRPGDVALTDSIVSVATISDGRISVVTLSDTKVSTVTIKDVEVL